jgi:hypothetical protein
MATAAKDKPKTEPVEPRAEVSSSPALRDNPEATIHLRMATILAELPAIGKDSWNEQQKFHFRGIDQVLNALNPLMAKHGVYVVPDVLDRVAAIRTTSSGKAMYEVNLHVRFRFIGLKGDEIGATGWGEGTDMADKATNKAMQGAFKYVLFQTFAISTEEASDQDGEPTEETVTGQPAEQAKQANSGGRAPEPPTKPGNWKEIKGWIETGYGRETWTAFQVFMQDAAEVVVGKREELSDAEEVRMGLITANAVGWLYELYPPGGAGRPAREQMRAAWHKALAQVGKGAALPGPEWRMEQGEEDRPVRGDESQFEPPTDA